jgi:3'-phosphoadenosine 5'-phosphosulfate sulfotransferase (PAPS reductase)/FAD synthetase
MWDKYGIVGKVHYGNRINALPYRRIIERKSQEAIALINQLHENTQGNWYVSCSFGVDSLVTYHLAKAISCNPLAVWVNQGQLAEWPDCLTLKDLMVSEGMTLEELTPDITLYDWYKTRGIPMAQGMDSKEDKELNAALMYRPIERFTQARRLQGYAWGLRGKGESSRRQKLLKQRGLLYQRKEDNIWVASPVGWWSKAEIFAYLDLHELPYPAMYGLNREEIRNGPPLGTTAINLGRLAKLREYFPDIWKAIALEFPELQKF